MSTPTAKMRQHAYLKITDEKGNILNTIAGNLGYLSRTNLIAACVHTRTVFYSPILYQ